MPETLTFEIKTREDGRPYCLSVTPDGIKIAWDTCYSCKQHIINCLHDVPVEPPYIKRVPGTIVDYAYKGTDADNDRFARARVAVRKSLNVMDLVDQDLVDKIKKGKDDVSS